MIEAIKLYGKPAHYPEDGVAMNSVVMTLLKKRPGLAEHHLMYADQDKYRRVSFKVDDEDETAEYYGMPVLRR